jgi:hypothetical protein
MPPRKYVPFVPAQPWLRQLLKLGDVGMREGKLFKDHESIDGLRLRKLHLYIIH